MTDVRLLLSPCTTPSPASDASLREGLVYHTRGCSLSVFHHFIRDGQYSNVGGGEVWKRLLGGEARWS